MSAGHNDFAIYRPTTEASEKGDAVAGNSDQESLLPPQDQREEQDRGTVDNSTAKVGSVY